MPEQRRLVVAINPNASFGKARDAGPRTVELLTAAGHDVRSLIAPTWELLAERAREELETRPDALVVVGGDGMVHLGVNLLAGTEVPLAVIPSGTGNDFAKAFDIPEHSVDAAVAGLLASLDGEPVLLDTGLAQWHEDGELRSRRFLGAVSCGFDAIVSERANSMRRPKGASRYTFAILRELAALRPIRYRIVHDGGELELDGVLVSVANNRSIGGGMLIAPHASMTDGLLDVFLVDAISRTKFLRLYPKVFRGAHVSESAVRFISTTHARVEAPNIVAYADGERLGPLPIDVSIVPASLRYYAPTGPSSVAATAS